MDSWLFFSVHGVLVTYCFLKTAVPPYSLKMRGTRKYFTYTLVSPLLERGLKGVFVSRQSPKKSFSCSSDLVSPLLLTPLIFCSTTPSSFHFLAAVDRVVFLLLDSESFSVFSDYCGSCLNHRWISHCTFTVSII